MVKVEQMEATFRTNVIGPLFLSKALIPLMKKSEASFSLIVNMSSSLGSIENNKKVMDSGGSGGGHYPYRTSKTALNMVTRSLSIDLEHLNIAAISIHPGWVRTDMGGKHAPLSTKESVEAIVNVIEQFNAEKHNGQFLDYQGLTFPW
jgi:NAD(P)-dependent dehydrogenase (short-subunit alcohol dehydrogenase family)